MQNKLQQQKLKSYLADFKPSWAGKFIYACFPYKKEIVLKNMRLVFGAIFNEVEIEKFSSLLL